MIIPDTDTDTDTSVDVVQDVMHQHLQQILHVYYCTQGVTETGNTHYNTLHRQSTEKLKIYHS